MVYWALSKMPIEGTISGDRSPTLLGLLSDTRDASVLVLDEARFTKEKRYERRCVLVASRRLEAWTQA